MGRNCNQWLNLIFCLCLLTFLIGNQGWKPLQKATQTSACPSLPSTTWYWHNKLDWWWRKAFCYNLRSNSIFFFLKIIEIKQMASGNPAIVAEPITFKNAKDVNSNKLANQQPETNHQQTTTTTTPTNATATTVSPVQIQAPVAPITQLQTPKVVAQTQQQPQSPIQSTPPPQTSTPQPTTHLTGSNLLAVGYDEGTVVLKLGNEEPAVSMDSSGKVIWAKHNEIQTINLKTVNGRPIFLSFSSRFVFFLLFSLFISLGFLNCFIFATKNIHNFV